MPRRRTSSGDVALKRFPEIDRLRGLAIVLAVFNHEPLHWLVMSWFTGLVGVHLFFVISGFVITRLLLSLPANSTVPLRVFYTRRFYRLAPMALLSMGFVLAASSVFNAQHAWSSPAEVRAQIRSILLLDYNYQHWKLGWDLIYFWSLVVEEHFYIV